MSAGLSSERRLLCQLFCLSVSERRSAWSGRRRSFNYFWPLDRPQSVVSVVATCDLCGDSTPELFEWRDTEHSMRVCLSESLLFFVSVASPPVVAAGTSQTRSCFCFCFAGLCWTTGLPKSLQDQRRHCIGLSLRWTCAFRRVDHVRVNRCQSNKVYFRPQ